MTDINDPQLDQWMAASEAQVKLLAEVARRGQALGTGRTQAIADALTLLGNERDSAESLLGLLGAAIGLLADPGQSSLPPLEVIEP